MPTIKLLESGYGHVRWSANLWFQWPKWRLPMTVDGFGWVTPRHLRDVLAPIGDPDDS